MFVHSRSQAVRYGVAAVAALIALGVRAALDVALGTGAELVAGYCAVALAAWSGGLGPGLLATAIGMLGGAAFAQETLALPAGTVLMSELLFGLAGALTSVLFERVHRERLRVASHDKERSRTEALLRETVDALAERERVLEAAQRLALIGSCCTGPTRPVASSATSRARSRPAPRCCSSAFTATTARDSRRA
jgi:hypothetical protein